MGMRATATLKIFRASELSGRGKRCLAGWLYNIGHIVGGQYPETDFLNQTLRSSTVTYYTTGKPDPTQVIAKLTIHGLIRMNARGRDMTMHWLSGLARDLDFGNKEFAKTLRARLFVHPKFFKEKG